MARGGPPFALCSFFAPFSRADYPSGMSPLAERAEVVVEVLAEGGGQVWTHPGWAEAFPWLVQGYTGRDGSDGAHDMSLFGSGRTADVLTRWEALGRTVGLGRWVHARQVHGSAVRFHHSGPPGLHLAAPCDGHVTASAGVLLTVSIADCVPVSMVAENPRAVSVLHAGWRGTADGVIERGIGVLGERLAISPSELRVHLGPSICGGCYEVGPEVHDALQRQVPVAPEPVDLGEVILARLVQAGARPDHLTRSGHCTRCGDSRFYSHRGGDDGRQVAFMGIGGG